MHNHLHMKYKNLQIFLIALCIGVFTLSMKPIKTANGTSLYVSNYENVLGTSFELKVKAKNEKQAETAENAALQEITRLSTILSGYDANSEFSKWTSTKNQEVKISKELMEVLSQYEQWTAKTNGALNPSAETINQLWKMAASKQQLPSNNELKDAVSLTQQQHWQIDINNGTATHLSNAALKLNSFVKSYIIQHATEAAMKCTGVTGIVMNIGGDILVKGDVNEKVMITDPRASAINDAPLDMLQLNNKAIATSGNYRRGTMIQNKWYSHIVDPRTGMPAEGIISATVVSQDAVEAGALATAFNVLTTSESVELAKRSPDAEYLIITNQGERIESKGWNAYETHTTENRSSFVQKENDWNADFELTINLELAQQPGFAKRPFAAIWVTDSNKKPVRNVSVWYNKPKWLRDLRAWYSAYIGAFSPEMINIASISSATRSAGIYTIKWDGKDDKGNFVKQDTYTINIEVAREHGTYQLMQQEVKCSKAPQALTMGGNTEVSSVTIDYKKKAK